MLGIVGFFLSPAQIPDAWKEWLLKNRDRGCDPEGLMQRALDEGFPREAIAAVLDSSFRGLTTMDSPSPDWLAWFEAPLTRSEHRPRAWRLDTSLAQVYELPALLSHEECEQVIDAINGVTAAVNGDPRQQRLPHQSHLSLAPEQSPAGG